MSRDSKTDRGVESDAFLAMALVLVSVTSLCLLLIRRRLQARVMEDLSRASSTQDNALLAELPTPKALMTSGDDLTIQDGADEFRQISGMDLLALASGLAVAVYTKPAHSLARRRAKV